MILLGMWSMAITTCLSCQSSTPALRRVDHPEAMAAVLLHPTSLAVIITGEMCDCSLCRQGSVISEWLQKEDQSTSVCQQIRGLVCIDGSLFDEDQVLLPVIASPKTRHRQKACLLFSSLRAVREREQSQDHGRGHPSPQHPQTTAPKCRRCPASLAPPWAQRHVS